MAVGSSTLGLLFKIGVDTSGAQKEVNSLTSAFKDGLGKGAAQGVKDFETAATGAFHRVGTALNQTRSGLESLFHGDVIGGTTQLGRQFGVLAVGLGAVAAAGLAVKKSIEGILDVAEKVGTDSKEDFEEFQKAIARVGGQVTLLDHALAQELLKSAKDVKSAFDNMFVKMLEIEGPALILLFNNIVKFINGPLTTASDNWAKRQVEGIIQFIALGRSLDAYFNLPRNLRTFDMFQKITPAYIEQVRRELEGLTASFQGATGTFDPGKATKVAKDASDAAERERKARLALLEADNKREQQIYEATALSAKLGYMGGALTAAEATTIELIARQKLMAELEKNAEEESQLNKKKGETATEAAKRELDLAIKRVELQKDFVAEGQKFQEELNKADAQQRKNDEERLKRLDKILETTEKLDQIVRGQARAPQPIPGGGTGIPGLLDPAEIQRQLDEAHKKITSFLETLKQGFADAAQRIQDDLSQAIHNLPYDLVHTLTDAFEHLLDVFIQTGKTGPSVMKQFVSAVLQSVALLAAHLSALAFAYALLMLAFQNYHDAAIAAAAGVALAAVAIGIGLAARAVAPSQAGAAAGGGSFGGGAATQAPGTVTINQGAGSGLGIQLQQLNALNNISNTLSTASPGDVVTRGAEQNPVAIGQANNEAARRDGTVSREFLQISGLRTA
jgi:hypothetical protein